MSEFSFNDGLRHGGRRPRLVLVDKTGTMYHFTGESIPGVCVILTEKFEKNGKWSNTTFAIVSASGVSHVVLCSPMHGKVFQDCATWGDVFVAFSATIQGKIFDREGLKIFIGTEWPDVATRLTSTEATLASLESSESEAESDVVEVDFGSPNRRTMDAGFWTWPIEVMSHHDDGEPETPPATVIATVWPDGSIEGHKASQVKILSRDSRPGMKGGFRTIRLAVPSKGVARHARRCFETPQEKGNW